MSTNSRTKRILETLDELNKKQEEVINNFIESKIENLSGAIAVPEFSRWLNKAVKQELKKIHPDIAGNNPKAVAFVNAWNVIKQFVNRNTSPDDEIVTDSCNSAYVTGKCNECEALKTEINSLKLQIEKYKTHVTDIQNNRNICKACATEFVPKRNDALYCSSKCRQANYRNRQKK